MNYRHIFHAGNFADVLKHAVLTRLLLHLCGKEAAFRVVDTHAGAGRYDLAGAEAGRTGEWREGIGRLLDRPPDGAAGRMLEPYLAAVRAENAGGELKVYPGSPALAQRFTRPQDRMIFSELHPGERKALAAAMAQDRRAKVVELDGWNALKAHLPPPERRGLILIDPPFEQPGEFQRLEQGLTEAHRRFATGVFLVWYPIKNERETGAFARRIARLPFPKILRIELATGPAVAGNALSACGLLAVNPPWTLEGELARLLPTLARILGRGSQAGHRLDWLAGGP